MQVAKGVYLLPLTNEQGTVFVSLISDGGHTVLVDTGYPGEFLKLREALESEGFSVSDLTDVIITHHDIDHIGCIKELLEANPNIRVSASKEESRYLEGELEPEKVAKMWMDFETLSSEGQQFFFQFEQAFKTRRVSVNKILVTRNVLPYVGGIEIVGTSGHTKGHIALYIKKAKILIAGDALRVVDGELALPAQDLANNYTSALDSVRRLRKYDIDMVVCYHGGLYESDQMTADLTTLLESAGVLRKPAGPVEPKQVDLGIVATSPADGPDQVFGEGDFPACLDRVNYTAWFFDFFWSAVYSLPVWAVLFFLMFVVGYTDQYLLGLTGMSAQTIPVVVLLLGIVFQLVRIVFAFHANRLAWNVRARRLASLTEKASYENKMAAGHLARLRKKKVGPYLKYSENWAFIWGALFVINAVLTFFELAPQPSDSLSALKAMWPAFAVTPILFVIVYFIDKRRRSGIQDSEHAQEAE